MEDDQAMKVKDVWTLGLEERWQLCRYWYDTWFAEQSHQIPPTMQRYENLALRLQEYRREEDIRVLKQAKVIGMTTSGAAKHRSVLQEIQPKIVVVEEAAEVLESHIVTTLTSKCQHLILIGDHQQLRPNPTVYDLVKNYNLDISLFERMIKNELHHEQLSLQHRMRPEIAKLMKHIYKKLENHEPVKNYEDIKGVSKNIFFIKHEQAEALIEETKSKANMHEAEYVVALCQYFLLQGYTPSQITILTMYTAQLFELKKLMKNDVFRDVRVCAVDNFQGEENDIILLSLVRSNDRGSIGFLNIANRVCVALSRARMGFYCIGNFKLLRETNELWQKIVTDLLIAGNIGTSLKLHCRNHPIITINASCAYVETTIILSLIHI